MAKWKGRRVVMGLAKIFMFLVFLPPRAMPSKVTAIISGTYGVVAHCFEWPPTFFTSERRECATIPGTHHRWWCPQACHLGILTPPSLLRYATGDGAKQCWEGRNGQKYLWRTGLPGFLKQNLGLVDLA